MKKDGVAGSEECSAIDIIIEICSEVDEKPQL
jgi:hypothetical protein